MALFEQKSQQVPSNLLKDRFGWPPFSILNTISHDWQRRKDEWEIIVGDSTEGRDLKRYNATPTNTFSSRGSEAKEAESISTFDPYLCELMYRWFSLPNGKVLDPFAGGCVRGEVGAILGRHYTGIDLSKPQVRHNKAHFGEVQSKYTGIVGDAQWLQGDSELVLRQFEDDSFDFVLTCPPYYNLERYTREEGELSRLPSYEMFLAKYGNILKLTADKLKQDSFFVIVVSEIRAEAHDVSQSQYLGFVPDTVKILQNQCSLLYYNEIILENNIGSLPMRAPKNFQRSRKIGRHHQNILVFYKGDIANIETKFHSESYTCRL